MVRVLGDANEPGLKGRLGPTQLPDLLTFLNMGRRTGVLVLERPHQQTRVFFQQGSPVFGASNKDELQLSNLVIRLGKVKREVVERTVRQTGTRGHRIGPLLVAEGALPESELTSILKVQVSEVIFDTFVWEEGTFGFFDEVPPPAGSVTLHMDLMNLIMEGARRIDERGRLSQIFPDLTQVVEPLANPERVRHSMTLTPAEWEVLFLVDGRRTLGDICQLTGNPDDLATLGILHNLLTAKLIALGQPRSPTADLGPELGQGTITVRPEIGVPDAGDFSFSFGTTLRSLDDSVVIVTRGAVPYMKDAQVLTVGRLILTSGAGDTIVSLTRDSLTLGRHRNNDIVIADTTVSAFHARIDRQPEGFVIVDLKSRNGTFLNSQRIESAPLKHGDELRLGASRLRYEISGAVPAL
jgi:hypothetical protein